MMQQRVDTRLRAKQKTKINEYLTWYFLRSELCPAMLLSCCAVVSILALARSQVKHRSPSVFLDDAEFAEFIERKGDLECKMREHRPIESENVRITFPLTRVRKTLDTHVNDVSKFKDPSTLHVFARHEVVHANVPKSSPSGRPVTYISAFMESPAQRVCTEMLLYSGRVDVVLPFSEIDEFALTSVHNVSYLERHFGIPFLIPPPPAISDFRDKAAFARWMVGQGFGEFVPAVFSELSDVTFPAVVKPTNETSGRGVTVVLTASEMFTAIDKLQGSPYLIQEAIPGKIEISPNFIARDGVLLAMLCAVNRQPSELTVVSVEGKTDTGYPVKCSDIDKIAPLYSVMTRIVAESHYNGFGVANVKLRAASMSETDLARYLEGVADVELESPEIVTTTFSGVNSIDEIKEKGATIKFFEINARIGGPLLTKWPYGKLAMIERYLDDMLGAVGGV